MKYTDTEWKENYKKTRNFALSKIVALFSVITSLSIYIFQTIVLQTDAGTLSSSQVAFMLLSIGILLATSVFLYEASITVSKTYRDEGMDLKIKCSKDHTLMKFSHKMDRCFRNIVLGITSVTMLFTLMIFIALLHAFSFPIAVIFSGAYLILTLMMIPNICKIQARKKTFFELYDPSMSLKDMNDLVYQIAKTFKGKVVHSKTRRVISTPLSKNVSMAKNELKKYMYIFSVLYIVQSIAYYSTTSPNVTYFGYFTFDTNTYCVFLSLLTISFLFAQRYLYAQVTSGDALKRRRIARKILGDNFNIAA